MPKVKNMDQKIVENIKSLGLDMINEANSGHPGIVLGATNIIFALYGYHLNINPKDPLWLNRDRFVLSAGHGSALLYSTLYMAGYDLSVDDLKKFRKLNSKTPGHPEYGITPGVDMTTGPLGQGFAAAVGMAIGEKHLKAVKKAFDYNIYVLCSDGDLMEGISYESASLAGNLKLDNLIVLYDSNDVCLDGKTKKVFKDNIAKRFEALGWNVIRTSNTIKNIDKAINKAKKQSSKPTIIEVKTIIGEGSLLEGTNKVHGSSLETEDFLQLKKKLEVRNVPFTPSKEAVSAFKKMINSRLYNYKSWMKEYKNVDFFQKEIFNIKEEDLIKQKNFKEALRITGSKALNLYADNVSGFIGGSADLATSTKVYLEKEEEFSSNNYEGKNIRFGIREHAMGAILIGLSLSNLKSFGSTFLVFSDYLKPSIRLAAIMNIPVTYIFTHDSINVGKDGPTHEPIEQLAMLRSIPNINVYRPADAKEVIGVYNEAFSNDETNVIILSRSVSKLEDGTKVSGVSKGAYVIKFEKTRRDVIIIATGTEVNLAINVARDLEAKQIDVRVVSMSSREKFLKMSHAYQNEVLPVRAKKVVIEMGSKYGWDRFATNSNYIFGLEDFGKSGSPEDVMKSFGFTTKLISKKIEELLK